MSCFNKLIGTSKQYLVELLALSCYTEPIRVIMTLLNFLVVLNLLRLK